MPGAWRVGDREYYLSVWRKREYVVASIGLYYYFLCLDDLDASIKRREETEGRPPLPPPPPKRSRVEVVSSLLRLAKEFCYILCI